jgi:hypothetical protein
MIADGRRSGVRFGAATAVVRRAMRIDVEVGTEDRSARAGRRDGGKRCAGNHGQSDAEASEGLERRELDHGSFPFFPAEPFRP